MANHTGKYTLTYDTLQRKQTVVTPVGKVITYSYDALSRKSQMQVLDAGVFTYSYDANNQLKTVQNPQNDRTTFSYDNAGRRILNELTFSCFRRFPFLSKDHVCQWLAVSRASLLAVRRRALLKRHTERDDADDGRRHSPEPCPHMAGCVRQ